MQFTLLINQVKAVEWGLNAQQSMLFAFLYELSSWADAVEVDGITFYRISKSKILRELPLLTDKPDTAYRLLKQLEAAKLITIGKANDETVVALTDRGRTWNKSDDDERRTIDMVGASSSIAGRSRTRHVASGTSLPQRCQDGVVESESVNNSVHKPRKKIRASEKYPGHLGKISDPPSEKNPTYQITNNQLTKSHHHGEQPAVENSVASLSDRIAADRAERWLSSFDLFCRAYPRDPVGNSAWEAFCEAEPDDALLDWMLGAIADQRIRNQWHRDGGRWVPRPERWLRERRWLRSPGARVDQFAKGSRAGGTEKNPEQGVGSSPEVVERGVQEMRRVLAGGRAA